jgi:hypothetical protein
MMYRIQVLIEDFVDYLIYKFLNTFYSAEYNLMPHEDRMGNQEFLDLQYYHHTIFDKFKIGRTINPNITEIKLKKLYLLRALGPYNKGYNYLLSLSDKFWQFFSFVQILYIAKVYNQFPIILAGNKKPIISKNRTTKLWRLVSRNRHGVNYQYHAMDCFRTTIGLIGLGNNLSQNIEYGFVNYNNFYSTHRIKTKYVELSTQMLNCFDLHCAELERYGYYPTSHHMHNSKTALHLLRIGDVIYSNPLDYTFNTWEGMEHYIKCHMTGMVVNKIMDDLVAHSWYSTVNIDLGILMEAVHHYLIDDNDLITGNLSDYQIAKVVTVVKKDIKYLLSTPKTRQELELITKFIHNEISNINQESDKLKAYMKTTDHKGRPIEAKRSKFHVCSVVDIQDDKVFVINIDGGNPLIPMQIVNFNSIARDHDKIVIFRHTVF